MTCDGCNKSPLLSISFSATGRDGDKEKQPNSPLPFSTQRTAAEMCPSVAPTHLDKAQRPVWKNLTHNAAVEGHTPKPHMAYALQRSLQTCVTLTQHAPLVLQITVPYQAYRIALSSI